MFSQQSFKQFKKSRCLFVLNYYYQTHNAFQDCTWTFLTNYLSDPDQKKDLLDAFKDIDLDGDG